MSQHYEESSQNQTLNEMTDTIIRELQRPAIIVHGYLDLLLRDLAGSLNEDQREMISSAKKLTTYIKSVIHQAITVRGIEGGLFNPDPQHIEILSLLTTIIQVAQQNYSHKHHNITIECTEETVYIYADNDQTRIALLQIIENAIKYTPTGRNITIQCRASPSTIDITISDQGIGIPLEYHQQLFQGAIAIPRQHYDELYGLGLGLYITRKLLVLSKATISLKESTENGTSFLIKIPRKSS